MDEQISNLSRRVQRLESFNRLHLVVSSLVVAAVVAVGQLPPIWADKDGPKSFSAQEFVLVDQSGRTTARLAAAPKGGAVLTFYDPKGKRTVSFGSYDDGKGAGEDVYDGNTFVAGTGVNRANFGVGGPGGTGFGWGFFQPNGITVLAGGTLPDGTAQGVYSYDSNGINRTFEGVDSLTLAGLFVSDANGNTRTVLDVDSSANFVGMSTLAANGTLQSVTGGALDGSNAFDVLYDAAGTLEALKVVNADGSVSGDSVYDANGVQRVLTYQDPTQTPAQGVKTFDSSGNPLADLP